MGSLVRSPWQCLRCNKCHASIRLLSGTHHNRPDTHHNQPMGSLMVAIHLLLVKVIRQLVTLRVVHTLLLKVTPRAVHTLHLLKAIPRVVRTHHLVTHHKVPTPRRKVLTPHRVILPSKEHTEIGEMPLPGNQDIVNM